MKAVIVFLVLILSACNTNRVKPGSDKYFVDAVKVKLDKSSGDCPSNVRGVATITNSSLSGLFIVPEYQGVRGPGEITFWTKSAQDNNFYTGPLMGDYIDGKWFIKMNGSLGMGALTLTTHRCDYQLIVHQNNDNQTKLIAKYGLLKRTPLDVTIKNNFEALFDKVSNKKSLDWNELLDDMYIYGVTEREFVNLK